MKKITVPLEITDSLQKFFVDKSIKIEIVTEGGDLKIEDTGPEKQESDLSTLYSGGWVTCATARTLAGNLGIKLDQMGEMLDHLNIKVKLCGLGCF